MSFFIYGQNNNNKVLRDFYDLTKIYSFPLIAYRRLNQFMTFPPGVDSY